MNNGDVRLVPVSETSLMLYLADEIDVSLAGTIGKLSQRIKMECPGVYELTPSYTSILVEAADVTDELGDVLLSIAGEELACSGIREEPGKRIELPVYYHRDVGLDLDAVAGHAGLSVDEVIRIHSGMDYTVCAIGFAPGFAFLADVDERLVMPRRDRPRACVPAGSVAIAQRQTAVYPGDSPGGWNVLGNCPVPLYDPDANPMCPFEVGDRVRFVPIGREEFIERGGRV